MVKASDEEKLDREVVKVARTCCSVFAIGTSVVGFTPRDGDRSPRPWNNSEISAEPDRRHIVTDLIGVAGTPAGGSGELALPL